jgi:hypothetical protein
MPGKQNLLIIGWQRELAGGGDRPHPGGAKQPGIALRKYFQKKACNGSNGAI